MSRLLLCTATILALTASANAQCGFGGCGNDIGRGVGMPPNPGPYRAINHDPATGRSYAYPARSNSATQAQPPKIGHCDWLCQRKCQATWQRGNLPSVEACYTKWSRLNAMGIARTLRTASMTMGETP